MRPDVLKKYRQVASELSRQLKIGNLRRLTPERAFISWYLEAKLGKSNPSRILDGKKDGGIDAISEIGEVSYVLQSKYETSKKVGLVTRTEITSFENLAHMFKDKSAESEFNGWLLTIRPELRQNFTAIRSRALSNPQNVRFIFITTKRSDYEDTEFYEIEDIQNIAALWYLYSEGFTPPTEFIDLDLENAWFSWSDKNNYKTFVGLADIKDFLALMKNDANERLFAQNVRTNLHSGVNEHIKKTYLEEPDVFWLCNNGIYIVCNKVTSSGNQYRLVYPSVINGSQTLHAIAETGRSHSCKILVRVLEMNVLEDTKLLGAVVRRTNSQNAMKPINLFAHDIHQLNIATYLDRYKIFYERREKEWRNEKKSMLTEYHPVNIKDVAQWLSTLDDSIGLGVARSQVSGLFEEDAYTRIFGDFGRDFQTTAYVDLVQMIWVGIFTDNAIRWLPKKDRAFGKMSRLMLAKLIYGSLQRTKGLTQTIDFMLQDHRTGKRKIPRIILRSLKEVIGESEKIQRKEQAKDSNIDYSNFYKRNDLVRSAYKKISGTSAASRLKRALKSGMSKIS